MSSTVRIICLATKADHVYLDACAALERRTFPKHESMADDLRKEAMKRTNKLLIALADNNDVVGYLLLSLTAEAARVLKIVVAPAMRRKGIGRQLMESCLQYVERARVGEVYLHVDPERAPAVALYQSFGFQEVATIPGYYREDREARLMKKIV